MLLRSARAALDSLVTVVAELSRRFPVGRPSDRDLCYFRSSGLLKMFVWPENCSQTATSWPMCEFERCLLQPASSFHHISCLLTILLPSCSGASEMLYNLCFSCVGYSFFTVFSEISYSVGNYEYILPGFLCNLKDTSWKCFCTFSIFQSQSWATFWTPS